MNKNLIIEIKDTHVNCTVTSFSHGKWRVLFYKQYNFRLTKTNITTFEISWIEKFIIDMKRNFESINFIDKTTLVVKTIGTLIKTNEINVPLESDFKDIKKIIKNHINEKIDNNFVLVGSTINNVDKKLMKMKMNISFTYEILHREFLNQIKIALQSEGIKINDIIPSHKVNRSALKPMSMSNELIYNVNIDEKHTLINIFSKGLYLNTIKINQGLEIIYKNISEKLEISKESAIKFFKTIGEIPPESITDNKIIYNKKTPEGVVIASYSKKELSRYITEKVNEIFSMIAKNLNGIKNMNPTLIFSGEITMLKGFEDYSKISLSSTNKIFSFKSNIIGINVGSAITTMGVLNKIQNQIKKTDNNIIQLSKITNLTRYKTKYLILEKIKKQFNYL